MALQMEDAGASSEKSARKIARACQLKPPPLPAELPSAKSSCRISGLGPVTKEGPVRSRSCE